MQNYFVEAKETHSKATIKMTKAVILLLLRRPLRYGVTLSYATIRAVWNTRLCYQQINTRKRES